MKLASRYSFVLVFMLCACSGAGGAPGPGSAGSDAGAAPASGGGSCSCHITFNGTSETVGCASDACIDGVHFSCAADTTVTQGGSCTSATPDAGAGAGGACAIGPAPIGKCPSACTAQPGPFSVQPVGGPPYDHLFCTDSCGPGTACPSGYTCNSTTKRSWCTPSCVTVADCPPPVHWADCNSRGFCE
jgi:hypothetical protein